MYAQTRRDVSGFQGSDNEGIDSLAPTPARFADRHCAFYTWRLRKPTPLASLIDAINIKRRTVFEHENAPFSCLEAEISTPTARGGQTLVRLKVRNLLTGAVLDKTFKAGEKFKEAGYATGSGQLLI